MRATAAWLLTGSLFASPGVVGAGAAAVGLEERGASLTELRLAQHVEIALFADPRVVGVDVADVEVGAAEGRITLRGAVATEAARRAATAAAAAVAGVTAVRNALRVVPGDAPQGSPLDRSVAAVVEQQLRVHDELRGVRITGVVEDGVVTLRGRVPDGAARAVASRVARNVTGVRAVRNELWAERLAPGRSPAGR